MKVCSGITKTQSPCSVDACEWREGGPQPRKSTVVTFGPSLERRFPGRGVVR